MDLVLKNMWLGWESMNASPTGILFTVYYLMIPTQYIFFQLS